VVYRHYIPSSAAITRRQDAKSGGMNVFQLLPPGNFQSNHPAFGNHLLSPRAIRITCGFAAVVTLPKK